MSSNSYHTPTITIPSFIGILPAAGLGSRLHPLRYPKELIPIAFVTDPLTMTMRPMLAVEHSLRSMSQAGVNRCIVVISDRKPEMLRYLGNGADAGLSIAYVSQPEPLGLASAVDAAFEWTVDSNVCLALPDTVFLPSMALSTVNKTLVQYKADLVLGVFPTSNPQQLGPVRIGIEESVLEVLEKPDMTDLYNTWGIAAWTPQFSKFLHRPTAELRTLSISHVFNDAVKQGFNVRAVYFEGGSYSDLGTLENLAALMSSQQS